jgi:hypothetical protein
MVFGGKVIAKLRHDAFRAASLHSSYHTRQAKRTFQGLDS